MTKIYTPAEFIAALNKMSDKVRGDAMITAIKKGGEVVATKAKMNASGGRPGLNVDTGNLVNSITTFDAQLTTDGAEIMIGSGVEYARIHELSGWAGVGNKTFIPARPYLRPAAESEVSNVENAISVSLKSEIENL